MGAIGLAIANMAALKLPKKVIAIDVKAHRLEKSLKFGADVALNPMNCDIVAEILKLTEGNGCDVYIEASGNPASVKQGLDVLANLGRYVQMGVFAEEVTTDWNTIGDGKELSIRGSHLSALTYPAVIKGIESGSIKTEGLISHHFPLEQWKNAFETAQDDEDAMKIMLIP
ncbi:MAG: zinc-binding dehydrogenase, partial [Christensenella sp.]